MFEMQQDEAGDPQGPGRALGQALQGEFHKYSKLYIVYI
jgi:hypothetical protein